MNQSWRLLRYWPIRIEHDNGGQTCREAFNFDPDSRTTSGTQIEQPKEAA